MAAEIPGITAVLRKGPEVAGHGVFCPAQRRRPGPLLGVHIAKTAVDGQHGHIGPEGCRRLEDILPVGGIPGEIEAVSTHLQKDADGVRRHGPVIRRHRTDTDRRVPIGFPPVQTDALPRRRAQFQQLFPAAGGPQKEGACSPLQDFGDGLVVKMVEMQVCDQVVIRRQFLGGQEDGRQPLEPPHLLAAVAEIGIDDQHLPLAVLQQETSLSQPADGKFPRQYAGAPYVFRKAHLVAPLS